MYDGNPNACRCMVGCIEAKLIGGVRPNFSTKLETDQVHRVACKGRICSPRRMVQPRMDIKAFATWKVGRVRSNLAASPTSVAGPDWDYPSLQQNINLSLAPHTMGKEESLYVGKSGETSLIKIAPI